MAVDEKVSLYVYPNGERDAGIIIIASDEEVVGVEIDPFSPKVKRNFKAIEDFDRDLEDVQFDMAKDMYRTWVKN